jgi:hypothetical protein
MGDVLPKKNGALWLKIKRFPCSRCTGTAIEMLFLTPGSGFYEFREPSSLWGGALFGAEVAASDF